MNKTGDTLDVETQFIGQTGQYHSPRGAVLPATIVAARYIDAPGGQALEVDLVVTRPGTTGGPRPSGPFLETVRGARTGSATAFEPHTFRPVTL